MLLPSKDKPYESWRIVRDDGVVRDSVLLLLKNLLEKTDQENLPADDGTTYEQQLKAWIEAKGIEHPSFKFA
ncbi:MAG: hypothetical protein V4646_07130 [Pseudomonadota bacterium]